MVEAGFIARLRYGPPAALRIHRLDDDATLAAGICAVFRAFRTPGGRPSAEACRARQVKTRATRAFVIIGAGDKKKGGRSLPSF